MDKEFGGRMSSGKNRVVVYTICVESSEHAGGGDTNMGAKQYMDT